MVRFSREEVAHLPDPEPWTADTQPAEIDPPVKARRGFQLHDAGYIPIKRGHASTNVGVDTVRNADGKYREKVIPLPKFQAEKPSPTLATLLRNIDHPIRSFEEVAAAGQAIGPYVLELTDEAIEIGDDSSFLFWEKSADTPTEPA